MKKKLLGTHGKIADSIIISVCFFAANSLIYILCLLAGIYIIIPSIGLYSDRLWNLAVDSMGQITPAAATVLWIASAPVSACLAAQLTVSFNKKRRKLFYTETFGMMPDKEGLVWFFEKFGVLDIALVSALSLILGGIISTGLVRVMIFAMPQMDMLVITVSWLPALLICTAINAAAMLLGVFFGMRKWRVFCFCE